MSDTYYIKHYVNNRSLDRVLDKACVEHDARQIFVNANNANVNANNVNTNANQYAISSHVMSAYPLGVCLGVVEGVGVGVGGVGGVGIGIVQYPQIIQSQIPIQRIPIQRIPIGQQSVVLGQSPSSFINYN